MVSVVSGLVVILFSVRMMWINRRCSDLPRQVSLLSCWNVFVCRTCIDHNGSVEEKLDFKKDEDILGEAEKFCYVGDMIGCYGGVSEAVSGSVWKRFKKSNGLLGSRVYISSNRGRFISFKLDQFFCAAVKRGNLLLRWRRGCVGWSAK